MTSSLSIRTFQAADTDTVVALWQACELTRPWNDPHRDIARKLAQDPSLFLVGEVDGELVASVMGGYDGHRGWVNYLAVHPAHQRQGFGEAMMHDLEARLLALGCPKINLQIRRDNDAVHAFYQRIGFAEDHVASFGKRLIPDTEPPKAS